MGTVGNRSYRLIRFNLWPKLAESLSFYTSKRVIMLCSS